ncbi:MAG TPA: CheR family methyltransferase [Steroidobacteraceae bacterium]
MARGSAEPQRFRGWIAQRLGLHFDDAKLEFLAEVLDRRADKQGLARRPYLDRLEGPDLDAELQALALELTVPETYFFRHIDQIHAFADVALPEAQTARGAVRKLNLLSAGCASGEEPYSLAMVVRERGADCGWSVDIRGFDLNPAMLAKAVRGRYSVWALRETPATSQRRWFRGVGKEFELDECIRAAVTFQEVNLAQENAELWAPARYDVIFCRNVLMYFTPDSAQALVARLTRSLAPGGHLFLGHAETLRGLSNDYHLRHTHGTFYYQLRYAQRGQGKCEDTLDGAWQDNLAERFVGGPVASAPDLSWTKTWVETIQNASDRIQALSVRPTAESVLRNHGALGGAAKTSVQLPVVLELLKNERFSDALDLLARLPAESAQDADVLLLRAALLTHSGQLSTAESVSMQLLEQDELNTGAHYLLALCRENAGDRQGALDHDRSAIYLDSGFAMPRLHLGLMAKRAGDWEGAHNELRQALLLLKREDASRLLLFGGGFGREALIALCDAELKSAGGAP